MDKEIDPVNGILKYLAPHSMSWEDAYRNLMLWDKQEKERESQFYKEQSVEGNLSSSINEEDRKMDGIASDKVNIHVGEGGNGHDNSAAIIAALGNRNQGGDNAALIAALSNRRDDDHSLWPLLMLAFLGRGGRGGVFGGDDNGDGNCLGPIVLSKLGTIEGAVPLAAANVENAICRSTGEVINILNQNNLSQLQASAGVKDAVQNGVALLLQSNNQNTKEVLNAICGLGSKIDANLIQDLQRQLGVAQAAVADERHERRSRDVEVTVSQNVNQQQAQQQSQTQLQQQTLLLQRLLCELSENTQLSRATAANTSFIIGNTGAVASGAQTATPTSTNVAA